MQIEPLRFDRHALFNEKDNDFVLDLIQKIMMSGNRDSYLINCLYGLFDGYLYLDMMGNAKRILSDSYFDALRELVNRIIKEDIDK